MRASLFRSHFERTEKLSPHKITNRKRYKQLIISTSLLACCSVFATTANAQKAIPLEFVANPDGSISRLGIWASINGGGAQRYMFDTGSDLLNTQMNRPIDGVVPVGSPRLYGYGDGTYGYVIHPIQFENMTYLDPNDKTKQIVTLDGGYEVGYITDNVYTLDSIYAKGVRLSEHPVFYQDGREYYADLDFRERVAQDLPADEGGLFSGTYGSGDFLFKTNASSMLAGRTSSGYVISANTSRDATMALTPGCAPCVTLHLDASMRSQFTTLIPWGDIDLSDYHDPIPGSGANGSVQYKGVYTFEFTIPGQDEPITWTGPVMMDTGVTSSVLLENAALVQQLKDAGVVFDTNGNATINKLTVAAAGGESVSIEQTTVNYMDGRVTSGLILGLPFFLERSVMYDLEGKQSGYSPYFVTAENFTTDQNATGSTYLALITNQTGNSGFLGVAGSISGSGIFYLEPNTDVRLSGNNTYTGVTYISPNAYLSLAGPGRIEHSAEVSNYGIFDISQRGNAVAGWGVDDSENDTYIRSLSGSGTVSLGSRALYITNAFGDFSGNIQDLNSSSVSQGGSLTIAGGVQRLSGQNTYSGMTNVMPEATLILDGMGSLAGNAAIGGALINNGAIAGLTTASGIASISGAGTFGALDMEQGTLITPTPISNTQETGATISVTGDFTQRAGSRYSMNILGNGASDHIEVGGAANIEEGASLLIGKRGGGFIKLGSQYTVLAATGGITGSYSYIDDTIDQATPFLTYNVYNDPNRISLEIERSNVAFTDVARTGNTKSVASAADKLALTNPVYGNIVGLNEQEAQAAFNLLSGEVHSSGRSALLASATVIQDIAGERIRSAFGSGRPAQLPVLAYGPTGLVQAGSAAEKYAVWGQAFHNQGYINGNGNSARTGNSATGFLAGIDAALSDWRVGALFGYSQTSFDVTDRNSTGKGRNFNAGVYAGTQIGAFGFRAGAAYSWHDIETKRHVAFASLSETLSANYHAGTFQAFGEVAYRIEAQRAAFEPYANLSYVHLRTAGFSETGGAAALSTQAHNTGTTFTTVGVRASTDFFVQDKKLSVSGGLAWRHVAGGFEPAARMAFSNGSTFGVEGSSIARNAALLELGFDAEISHAAKFGVFYNGQLSDGAQQHGGNARFSLRF